jgi:hypothetical protein
MRMSIDKQPTTKESQMVKKMSPTALSPDEIELLFESIALDHLFIETLQTRHRDSLDFHDVSVWGVKSALQAAFDAGLRAAGGTPKQPVHRSRKTNGALSANGTATAFQA